MVIFLGCGAIVIIMHSRGPFDPDVWIGLVIGAGVLSFAVFSLYNFKSIVHAKQKVVNLPYVPPVNVANLPSDEVLVRGADKPPAPVETLLRAAQNSSETKYDELLRSSHGDRGG